MLAGWIESSGYEKLNSIPMGRMRTASSVFCPNEGMAFIVSRDSLLDFVPLLSFRFNRSVFGVDRYEFEL